MVPGHPAGPRCRFPFPVAPPLNWIALTLCIGSIQNVVEGTVLRSRAFRVLAAASSFGAAPVLSVPALDDLNSRLPGRDGPLPIKVAGRWRPAEIPGQSNWV